jgi:hypothetical protein
MNDCPRDYISEGLKIIHKNSRASSVYKSIDGERLLDWVVDALIKAEENYDESKGNFYKFSRCYAINAMNWFIAKYNKSKNETLKFKKKYKDVEASKPLKYSERYNNTPLVKLIEKEEENSFNNPKVYIDYLLSNSGLSSLQLEVVKEYSNGISCEEMEKKYGSRQNFTQIRNVALQKIRAIAGCTN